MKSAAVIVFTLLLVSTIIAAAPSYMDYESEYTSIYIYNEVCLRTKNVMFLDDVLSSEIMYRIPFFKVKPVGYIF